MAGLVSPKNSFPGHLALFELPQAVMNIGTLAWFWNIFEPFFGWFEQNLSERWAIKHTQANPDFFLICFPNFFCFFSQFISNFFTFFPNVCPISSQIIPGDSLLSGTSGYSWYSCDESFLQSPSTSVLWNHFSSPYYGPWLVVLYRG